MINREFLTLIGYRVNEDINQAGRSCGWYVTIHGNGLGYADSEADGWTKAYLHYTNAKPSGNWLDQFTPQEQELIVNSRHVVESRSGVVIGGFDAIIAKMALLLDQSYPPPKREIVSE